MSKERDQEIIDQLLPRASMGTMKLMLELIALRRERYRDRLEREENPVVRGHSLECKEILTLFK